MLQTTLKYNPYQTRNFQVNRDDVHYVHVHVVVKREERNPINPKWFPEDKPSQKLFPSGNRALLKVFQEECRSRWPGTNTSSLKYDLISQDMSEKSIEGTQTIPKQSSPSGAQASAEAETGAPQGEDCLTIVRVNSQHPNVPVGQTFQEQNGVKNNSQVPECQESDGNNGQGLTFPEQPDVNDYGRGDSLSELELFQSFSIPTRKSTTARQRRENDSNEDWSHSLLSLPPLPPPHETAAAAAVAEALEYDVMSEMAQFQFLAEAGLAEDITIADSTSNDTPGNRTKTQRYHTEGRGPQLCGSCQQPRKGHTCPFRKPDVDRCQKIRVNALAAFLYTNREDLAESHPILQGQNEEVAGASESRRSSGNEGEPSETESLRSSPNQEPRTKSSRYHKEGRGPQSCNLCGNKERKQHKCFFKNLSEASTENFVQQAESASLMIGMGIPKQALLASLVIGMDIRNRIELYLRNRILEGQNGDGEGDRNTSGSDDSNDLGSSNEEEEDVDNQTMECGERPNKRRKT
jgi:hypothetical protein